MDIILPSPGLEDPSSGQFHNLLNKQTNPQATGIVLLSQFALNSRATIDPTKVLPRGNETL